LTAANSEEYVIYTHSTSGRSYNISDCDAFKGPPSGTQEQKYCAHHVPILSPWQEVIDGALLSFDTNMGRTNELICRHHRNFCLSVREYQTSNSAACDNHYGKCQSALKHLEKMMFKEDSSQQMCNNFALKSVRAFFHDYMSVHIDGSLLWENEIEMNIGLCRYTQYVNALSDTTGCDPGSIIAMSGELGFEACGVDIWKMDHDVKPSLTINRPYPCARNINPKLSETHGNNERKEEFHDVVVSANSTAMENFWYAVNGHSHPKPDGEAEYSGEATAAAHSIGRVTCPVTSHSVPGVPNPDITTGFFHVPREEGMTLNEKFNEGVQKIRATQCTTTNGDGDATGGVRMSTTQWPLIEGETNLNDAGGLCSMPTQFLSTMRVGGTYRTSRFMEITQNNYINEHKATYSESQTCQSNMKMYIPYEILNTLPSLTIPSSPALDDFLQIAWDGVGTIDSAWDSCLLGCDIPVAQNRMCGGEGLGDWTFLGGAETFAPSQAPADDEDGGSATSAPTAAVVHDVSVTVVDGKFVLNGVGGNFTVIKGETYRFNAKDSSVIGGYHRFRVRQFGKYASPGGVAVHGDVSSGEIITWTVGNGVRDGSIEYMCRNHADMGGLFVIGVEDEDEDEKEGVGERERGGEGEGHLSGLLETRIIIAAFIAFIVLFTIVTLLIRRRSSSSSPEKASDVSKPSFMGWQSNPLAKARVDLTGIKVKGAVYKGRNNFVKENEGL